MDYILHLGMLIVGFVFLIKGADFFIDSSSSIARKFNISPFIIGLTLVAFGTSLPELAVSFVASLTVQPGQTADIAMGNVVGSNIVNITLILGLTALARPIPVSKTMHFREFPFLIFTTFLLAVLALFFQSSYRIIWWEAIILMIAFGFYIYLMITNKNKALGPIEIKTMDQKKSIVLLILGIAGVSLGGYMVTKGAEFIAVNILVSGFGMLLGKATTLVGLSIVSIGTSLPEMVTSIMAAKRGENEIAFGNIVGSNVFNALFIVGLSGLVTPLGINADVIFDIILLIFITIFAVGFSMTRGKVTKVEGLILVAIYAFYLYFIIDRALQLF